MKLCTNKKMQQIAEKQGPLWKGDIWNAHYKVHVCFLHEFNGSLKWSMHLFEGEKSRFFFPDGLFYAGLVLVYQCFSPVKLWLRKAWWLRTGIRNKICHFHSYWAEMEMLTCLLSKLIRNKINKIIFRNKSIVHNNTLFLYQSALPATLLNTCNTHLHLNVHNKL